MANVKNIKRKRFNRISIDDLYYQEKKPNTLRQKQEYKDTKKLKPDVLFDNNDYLYADVMVGNTEGKIYRNGLDHLGRYCVYYKNKKHDYFVTYSGHIKIIKYYK